MVSTTTTTRKLICEYIEQDISDELQTIRGAGSETGSNTLTWCLYLLAKNPVELEKLRKEADETIQGDICTFDEVCYLDFFL